MVEIRRTFGEQLISTLSLQWKKISPVEWNEKILKQPWPAAMGVLLNHLEQQLLKDKREHQLFRSWSKTVMTGISKADGEQFFIGTAIIGSHRMKKDSLSPTKLYLDWGYLGSDYLWNKSKPARTISKKSSRKNVLDELIQRKRKFTVKQYIAELNGFVTVRQAQRDLMNHPKLKKTGNTRGAVYFPISSQR
jgi:hypothetical protein